MTRWLTLLFAFVVSLNAADEPFYFVQLSDPQFGMYAKDADFAQDQANLAFAAATVNRLRPKFVVVTGDLVNKPGDRAQIAALKAELAKVRSDIPVYLVPGNHDVDNEPTPGSLARYREAFGRDYYTFDQGPLRGFVLNSVLIHSPGKAPDEAAAQEKWLRGELDRARRDGVRHIIVFQHHPYFVKSESEEGGYFNIPAERRKQYLSLLRSFGVRYVFAGHLHRNAEAADGGIHMITTGPIGMPLDDAKSGLRVISVGDSIEHRYYDLGALPNRLGINEAKR